MKKYFVTAVMILLIFVVNCYSQIKYRSESETRKDPKSVVDYFLILPKNATHAPLNTFEERKKSLVKREYCDPVIDLKNNYLQTQDFEEMYFTYTVCFFYKTDSSKIIAVTDFREYGETSDGSIKFYMYSNMKWTDITKKVMPAVVFEDFFKKNEKLPEPKYRRAKIYFRLLQIGTTIEGYFILDNDYERENKVTDYRDKFGEFDSKTINLVWNKEKAVFEIKK